MLRKASRLHPVYHTPHSFSKSRFIWPAWLRTIEWCTSYPWQSQGTRKTNSDPGTQRSCLSHLSPRADLNLHTFSFQSYFPLSFFYLVLSHPWAWDWQSMMKTFRGRSPSFPISIICRRLWQFFSDSSHFRSAFLQSKQIITIILRMFGLD